MSARETTGLPWLVFGCGVWPRRASVVKALRMDRNDDHGQHFHLEMTASPPRHTESNR